MIVVFGSINVDLVFCIPHLPISGETVVGPTYAVLQGGKGANQAVAAARAGAAVEMLGCVGSDPFAEGAIQSLRDEGVGISHLRSVAGATGCAAIGVDADGNNQIMVAAGANGAVAGNLLGPDLLSRASTVLLQMEVPPEANWQVVERAKKAGARVILNAAPAAAVPVEVLSSLDLLVVNALEARTVARAGGLGDDDPARCAQALASRFGIPVAVTLGAKGSLLCEKGGTHSIPTLHIDPVDTTGAGDTFCGVLAASLDDGVDLAEALARAGVAGALSCLKVGARGGMPTSVEIAKALQPNAAISSGRDDSGLDSEMPI